MKINLSTIILTCTLVVIGTGFPVSSTNAKPLDYCDGFQNPPVPSLAQEPFVAHKYGTVTDFAGGLIADLDNDRDPDLTSLDNRGMFSRSLKNTIFQQLISAAGYYPSTHGIAAWDFDNDGLQDVIAAPYYAPNTPIMLFRNSGNWNFTLVQRDFFENLLGFNSNSLWYSETIIIGDLDGDGLNDAYIPFYTYTDPYQAVFLRNTGNGFAEEALQRGLGIPGIPLGWRPEGAQAVDIDIDGDLDIYVAHHLLINDGTGYFTDARELYGLPMLFDEGIAFIDYDNDGLLDLYVRTPEIDKQLFRNTGSGFVNVGVSSGLACLTQGFPYLWGDSWADWDNDGDIDLQYTTGNAFETMPVRHSLAPRVTEPKYHILLNQGDGTFGLGFRENRWIHLSATADFDLDGDLDIYGMDENWSVTVNENILDKPTNQAVVSIVPTDESGKLNQQGVTVWVKNLCTYKIQTRVIGANNVFLAQGDYPAQFAVSSDCTYEIQVAFLKRGIEGQKIVTIPYNPNTEGSLKINVSRNSVTKEPYPGYRFSTTFPLISKNGVANPNAGK